MFKNIGNGIYWDECWNFYTGCDKISPACDNCYAAQLANRFKGIAGYPHDKPFKVTYHPERLNVPLNWKKPRVIFACNMGDIMHHDVLDADIIKAIEIIKRTPQHIYIILTKRAERLKNFGVWPDNVWLGVTAENQEQADKRIPQLMQAQASNKIISIEPMLSEIDLSRWVGRINWVICGGESGMGARPTNPRWIRNIRDICIAWEIPFLFKGWGELTPISQVIKNTGKKSEIKTQYGIYYKRGDYNKRLLDGREWTETPLDELKRPKSHDWKATEETSPSGKIIFRCSACKKQSVTPDNAMCDPCPIRSEGAQPIFKNYSNKLDE